MEIIIGDGSLVTYDGGDNAARALYFCVSHQVDEEENCVQEVLRMSRVLNETATSKKSVWCATGDESCTRECGPHDTKVSGENRAIIQSLSAVDDYFEAPSWRPRGEAMVDAVYTRVVEEERATPSFRYFTEALMYLDDVRTDEGPLVLLKDWPTARNETLDDWGFTLPDLKSSPSASARWKSRETRPQFSEDHATDLDGGNSSSTTSSSARARGAAAGGVFDLLPDLAVAGAAPFEFSNHVNLERGVLRPLGDDAGRRLCAALREGGDVCALDSVSELYRDGDGGGVCATAQPI
ncbi:hypothetical protein JL720_13948 [Aureococcus anophagefferens]|nr:hypothetical protein JL720_13948 [Aureococcus anophagefferens]